MTDLRERLTLDEAGRALLFTDARSANTFTDEPVSDEELSSIWELAKWAPTAANTQPLRVVYVRSEAGKERLVPLMAEVNQAKTASAPVVAILAADTDFHHHIPTVFPMRPEMQDRFEADPNRAASAQFNASLQIGYFILAVRAPTARGAAPAAPTGARYSRSRRVRLRARRHDDDGPRELVQLGVRETHIHLERFHVLRTSAHAHENGRRCRRYRRRSRAAPELQDASLDEPNQSRSVSRAPACSRA